MNATKPQRTAFVGKKPGNGRKKSGRPPMRDLPSKEIAAAMKRVRSVCAVAAAFEDGLEQMKPTILRMPPVQTLDKLLAELGRWLDAANAELEKADQLKKELKSRFGVTGD